MQRKGSFRTALALFCFLGTLSPSVPFAQAATIEEKAAKLPARSFCINSNLETAWITTRDALREMGIEITLEDKKYSLITTAFVLANYSRLRHLSPNTRPALKGRFTLKVRFEEVTPSFTKMMITLQARQNKLLPKSGERLLKSRGSFEKFLAYRVNQLAIEKQFPTLYEIRLGMNLIPSLKTERYRITEVEPFSPAGEAGFKNGDELFAIDQKPISIRGDLFKVLLPEEREKKFIFSVWRKGKRLDLGVWVVRVGELKEKLGIRFGWNPKMRCFSVEDIDTGSRAEKMGFARGDILTRYNDLEITSWTNYYRFLTHLTGETSTNKFTVRRADKLLTFVF